MKLRYLLTLAITSFLLAACNFRLAADVTPPPGYVPPTPAPTLGPLYPASAPDLENGASIFAEKCSPCHGVTGLGDGSDGKDLPVTVPAFALPETARKASPAAWYTMVSQGNLDRFMPPFLSLSEQDRWTWFPMLSLCTPLPTKLKQAKLCLKKAAPIAPKFSATKK